MYCHLFQVVTKDQTDDLVGKTQASKSRIEVKLIEQYTKRNLLQKVPYDVHSILMAGDASSEYKTL